jgi:hypothetical protein
VFVERPAVGAAAVGVEDALDPADLGDEVDAGDDRLRAELAVAVEFR